MRTRGEAKRQAREAELEQWQIEVPNDPVNEQVILTSMAIDRVTRKRFVKIFNPDTFFAEKHKAIFAAFVELERQGLEFDPAVLARFAPDVDIRIIEQLADSRSEVPANIDFHVDTLRWDNKRAQVAEGQLARFISALQDARATPDKLRALARSLGESFDDVESKAPFLRDRRDVVREMMANLRKRIAGEAFYPFGIKGLDFFDNGDRRVRPGAAPGLVTVITGMSGSGKTTLTAHALLGLARKRRKVLVGAWEVRAPMTLELMTTLSLGWDRTKILDGKTNRVGATHPMDHEELVMFEERAHKISKFITFMENPFRRGSVRKVGRVTNDDYLDIVESHIEASGCEVAAFDLFDRCLRYRKPDDEQEALFRMLEMTNEYNIHTILVHQQLIKGDGVRNDKKPSLQGLKGSSAYVDIAALIVAPHLPARWKNVPDDKFSVLGLKQRFGSPFGVDFDWEPSTGQIWGGRDVPIDEALWEEESEGNRDGALRKGERGFTPSKRRR